MHPGQGYSILNDVTAADWKGTSGIADHGRFEFIGLNDRLAGYEYLTRQPIDVISGTGKLLDLES
jgi:hypothetical protein